VEGKNVSNVGALRMSLRMQISAHVTAHAKSRTQSAHVTAHANSVWNFIVSRSHTDGRMF
jgi:hypothetical protein